MTERMPLTFGLVPGAHVRHPKEPGWGLGQVQSVAGNRVTVNFENRGKVTVIADVVTLDIVDPWTEKIG
jgi:Protein of unknown function (DUF3553)